MFPVDEARQPLQVREKGTVLTFKVEKLIHPRGQSIPVRLFVHLQIVDATPIVLKAAPLARCGGASKVLVTIDYVKILAVKVTHQLTAIHFPEV